MPGKKYADDFASRDLDRYLIDKLEVFLAENVNHEKGKQIRGVDIINLLVLQFLIEVLPNDPELQHIAKALGAVKPAVHATVQSLIERNVLRGHRSS